MKTVDIFLLEIFKNDFYQPTVSWQHKDKKILESLGNQLINDLFLTENQANLLIKILKEYRKELEDNTNSLLTFLDEPSWSKEFRQLDIHKNIYISDVNFPEIVVEFNYNKKIKDKLFSLSKVFDGDVYTQKPNFYTVPLTEKNISILVDNFAEYSFNFDKKILEFYNQIIEIKKTNKILFELDQANNNDISKKLELDIGINNLDNNLLLHDRKLKFQYNFSRKLDENSLKNKIAKRVQSDIHINSTSYSFHDLLSSLLDLQRFPVLIIFDPYQPDFSKNLLETIHQSFNHLGLEEKIGIFFRMDNATNKDFNLKIASLSYNCYLDDTIKLVGLSNKQLPKFIVKTGWKPQSLICFSPSFKNSKIYSYCDTVDLKICYTESKPVSGFDYAIM